MTPIIPHHKSRSAHQLDITSIETSNVYKYLIGTATIARNLNQREAGSLGVERAVIDLSAGHFVRGVIIKRYTGVCLFMFQNKQL